MRRPEAVTSDPVDPVCLRKGAREGTTTLYPGVPIACAVGTCAAKLTAEHNPYAPLPTVPNRFCANSGHYYNGSTPDQTPQPQAEQPPEVLPSPPATPLPNPASLPPIN